jgi:hypothetical protein
MKHLFIGILLCLFVLGLSGNGFAEDINLTDACNANRKNSVRILDNGVTQRCDGTNWVNASSGGSLSQVYSVSGKKTINIGRHRYCFLTTVYMESHSDKGEAMRCRVYQSGAYWYLYSYDYYQYINCHARCID